MNDLRNFTNLFISLFILFSFAANSMSQVDSLSENLGEFSEDDLELVEILVQYADNPVNINTASKNDLAGLPFISAAAADSILAIRKQKGKFRSKRELRPILGKEKYSLIKEFITAAKSKRTRLSFDHRNYYKYPEDEAVMNGQYADSPWHIYNKFYFNYSKNIRAGLVSQKDIGEKSIFDYAGGYALYERKKLLIILGNFRLQFGEGLAFSNPFSNRKSSFVTAPFSRASNRGRESLSSSENSSLFGLYTNINLISAVNLQFFCSRAKRDVQTSRYTDVVTGIDYDGYHRTESELKKEDRLTEQLTGLRLQYFPIEGGHLGLTINKFKYSPGIQFDIMNSGESAYRRQRFKFSGSGLNQFSIDYSQRINSLLLSGEFSASDRGSPAVSQNIFFDLQDLKLGLKYWHVSKNFQSPYGSVFDDTNPFPQGKEGIYAALQYKVTKSILLKGYKLLSKDLWRTYNSALPEAKNEWFCQLELNLDKTRTEFRLRSKQEEFYEQDDNSKEIRKTEHQIIARLQNEFRPAARLSLKSRLEYTKLDLSREKGLYFFQDLRTDIFKHLNFNGRITFFQTDSYTSRLYEYENDLPGSFSNFVLYGQGYTWYILLRQKLFSNFTFWFKFRYFYRSQKNLRAVYSFKESVEIDRLFRLQVRMRY